MGLKFFRIILEEDPVDCGDKFFLGGGKFGEVVEMASRPSIRSGVELEENLVIARDVANFQRCAVNPRTTRLSMPSGKPKRKKVSSEGAVLNQSFISPKSSRTNSTAFWISAGSGAAVTNTPSSKQARTSTSFVVCRLTRPRGLY